MPSIQASTLCRVQALRIPIEQPGTLDDGRDWYHLMLLEHGTRKIARRGAHR
jgi:hypothetical protein